MFHAIFLERLENYIDVRTGVPIPQEDTPNFLNLPWKEREELARMQIALLRILGSDIVREGGKTLADARLGARHPWVIPEPVAAWFVDASALQTTVESTLNTLNLPDAFRAFYARLCERLLSQSQKAHTLCKEFGHDGFAIYEYLFGKEPDGHVTVIQGSHTVHLRCYNYEDFLCAMFCTDNEFSISQRDYHRYKITRACPITASSNLPDGTAQLITVERTTEPHNWTPEDMHLFSHEATHQFLLLLQTPRVALAKLFHDASKEHRKVSQSAYWQVPWLRELYGEWHARNEVLCYLMQGFQSHQINAILTESEMYDFLLEAQLEILHHIDDNSITEPLFRALQKPNLHQCIIDGTNVVTMLKSNGYAPEEIVHLLSVVPLAHWPDVLQSFYAARTRGRIGEHLVTQPTSNPLQEVEKKVS